MDGSVLIISIYIDRNNRKSVSGIILSTERALDWHQFGRTATSMGVIHKEGPGRHLASLSRTTAMIRRCSCWDPYMAA